MLFNDIRLRASEIYALIGPGDDLNLGPVYKSFDKIRV
jgi:hypothetical protein